MRSVKCLFSRSITVQKNQRKSYYLQQVCSANFANWQNTCGPAPSCVTSNCVCHFLTASSACVCFPAPYWFSFQHVVRWCRERHIIAQEKKHTCQCATVDASLCTRVFVERLREEFSEQMLFIYTCAKMQQGGYRVNRLTSRLCNIPAPVRNRWIVNRLTSRLRTSYIV